MNQDSCKNLNLLKSLISLIHPKCMREIPPPMKWERRRYTFLFLQEGVNFFGYHIALLKSFWKENHFFRGGPERNNKVSGMITFLLLFYATLLSAQPVSMEKAGVVPLSDAILLNRTASIPFGGSVENFSICILNENRIVIAWEDVDAQLGGGWMMLDKTGKTLHQKLRTFIKPDGTEALISGLHSPFLHANMFGEGFLFGVSFFDWIGSLHPGNLWKPFDRMFGSDDGPCVQLIDSNGNYIDQVFFGFPQTLLEHPGKFRLSDAGFLSDGNLVLIAEDRQNMDGHELYGLEESDRVVLGTIVSRQGKILNGPFLIQSADTNKSHSVIWYGLGVGNGHFGVRYDANGVKYRFFKNDGFPFSNEISLPDEFNRDGRGEDCGWRGNGKDSYLLVTKTAGYSVSALVMDQYGKQKFNPVRIDSMANYGADRCDGDIDSAGNFIMVADYLPGEPDINKDRAVICVRFFNRDGTPKTMPFYLTSVKPEDWIVNDTRPRVAMRHGLAVVMWRDRNTNLPEKYELGLRIFKTPF